jgi:hypothetical protein
MPTVLHVTAFEHLLASIEPTGGTDVMRELDLLTLGTDTLTR